MGMMMMMMMKEAKNVKYKDLPIKIQ